MNYPIRHGLIENWNNMERLWERCMFEYLRVEPEEHFVLLASGAQVARATAALCLRAVTVGTTALSTVLSRSIAADGAAAEPAGEPRVHR